MLPTLTRQKRMYVQADGYVLFIMCRIYCQLGSLGWIILYNRNLLQEEIFPNHMILLSEEIFAIFDYCIHNRR